MKNLDAHLFICTNLRADGDSCGARGSVELRNKLKEVCKKELSDQKGRFRVNASGCLDHCAKGIAAVLYPQGKWFENLKSDDVDLLKAQIQKALDEKN